MCRNYNAGKCLVGNKNCLLKDKGANAKQGECELHGDYYIWKLKDKLVLSKKDAMPDGAEPLGYGLNFLTADEWAYKASSRFELTTIYDLE